MVALTMKFDPTRPKWMQIAEVIRERISDGTYGLGERVPSVLQLEEGFGIAAVTAHKVHRGLRAEGWITTEPGLGSFVSRQAAAGNEQVQAASALEVGAGRRRTTVAHHQRCVPATPPDLRGEA
ncbi:GntR family transcriptional regulator [Streptomyces sp. NPDC045456]|uniref:GntR family transcriptional regulator n=1 Tax=Streptomyces sp. NPDC045456 TaxID=3155254 RepID=UPI0033EC6303